MIIGVGTDIVHICRIQGVIARRGADALARKILTATEATRYERTLKETSRGVRGPQVYRALEADGKGPGNSSMITRFLAKRWAVKEAAYKSLSAHLTALDPSHPPALTAMLKRIELSRSQVPGSNRPVLTLLAKAASSAGPDTDKESEPGTAALGSGSDMGLKLHVSLTHDGEYVVAFVVTEKVEVMKAE